MFLKADSHSAGKCINRCDFFAAFSFISTSNKISTNFYRNLERH